MERGGSRIYELGMAWIGDSMMTWPKNVDKNQLRIEYYSGTGGGGQHRNKHQNACRMTHLPTGIQAQCEDQRSREQNRKQAFLRLSTKLIPLMKDAATIDIKVNTERIRTYHAKRNIVTDERLPDKTYNMDEILDGNLDPLLKDLHESQRNDC